MHCSFLLRICSLEFKMSNIRNVITKAHMQKNIDEQKKKGARNKQLEDNQVDDEIHNEDNPQALEKNQVQTFLIINLASLLNNGFISIYLAIFLFGY